MSKAIIGGIAAMAMGYMIWSNSKYLGCVIKEIPWVAITPLDRLQAERQLCKENGILGSKVIVRPRGEDIPWNCFDMEVWTK